MMTLVRSQRKCKGAKEEEGTAPRMIRGRHNPPENCQSWSQGHMIPAAKMVRSWECKGAKMVTVETGKS
jgi:hypothetical protein